MRPWRGVAQSGSAPVWGTGGRRFESSRPDQSPRKYKLSLTSPGSFVTIVDRGNSAVESALNQTATGSTDNGGPRRIIIADDESLIRLDLREMLTHLGYDVVGEAGDGRTAFDLARKLRPDLVIMDIKMPDMDGISAAEGLTAEKIAPVVLLTAYSDHGLVERAKEAGVVGYVVKPFREAELMPVIELSLARFEEFCALEREVGGLKEALESRKIVERAKGVLMEVHGMKESEAFHRIRKTSMDSRKSMREVAEAILLTHEMDFSNQLADASGPSQN
jgi:two-component system, response regulator PdtaR